MSSVLLTRPIEDNERLRDLLETQGWDVYTSPLITMRASEAEFPSLEGIGGMIVTSKNAVRLLSEQTTERAIPIYAVGDQTAMTAQEAGFERVYSAGGTIKDLVILLREEKQRKTILYLRGRNISIDLAGLLTRLEIKEHILYEMVKNSYFEHDVEDALIKNRIDILLLFSRRTAESFNEAIIQSKNANLLKNSLKRTMVLCLSDAVLECVSQWDWARSEVVSSPTESSMLSRLSALKDELALLSKEKADGENEA